MFCLSVLPIFPSRGWDYQPSFELFHQFGVSVSVWVQAVWEFHSVFTWETSALSYSLAVNNWHCQHPTCRRGPFSLQPFPAFISFRLLANVHSDLCVFWLAFLLRFHHVEIFSYDFLKNSVSKTPLSPWPTALFQILFLGSTRGHLFRIDFFFSFQPCESGVAQSCPTLCDPMDCSLPGSSVHGIFQAGILEWVAISFSLSPMLLLLLLLSRFSRLRLRATP